MQQITLRIPEDTLESLEDEANEHGISRSEHIRNVLETRNEHDEHTDALQEEIDDLERELDRVRNEKRLLLEEREEKKELVRYVEQERTVEQQWREAGLTTRMKWRLFRMPSDDDEGSGSLLGFFAQLVGEISRQAERSRFHTDPVADRLQEAQSDVCRPNHAPRIMSTTGSGTGSTAPKNSRSIKNSAAKIPTISLTTSVMLTDI